MKKIRTILLLIVFFFAFDTNAQTVPVIVDQDEFSVTVKYKGDYKTMTCMDIVDAMATGTMTKLPLPSSAKAKKIWIELAYEPVISPLGIHPKETKATCQNNTHSLPSHAH